MSEEPRTVRRGRLLVGGERYAGVVERPGRRMSKYHPQSVADACRVLAPQLAQLVQGAEELSPTLRGDNVIFEAKMLPNYLANMYFPAAMLSEFHMTALGSRAAVGYLDLPSRQSDNEQTKTLILSASPDELERLRGAIAAGQQGAISESLGEEIRRFARMGLATASEVVHAGPREPSSSAPTSSWEAVLHPDPDSSTADLRPLRSRTFRKFEDLVSELGGEVLTDWTDTVGGLTFVPVRLGRDAVDELAAFNALRSVSPMGRMRSLVPTSLRRYTAPAPLAPEGETPVVQPSVLVFDGGLEPDSPYFEQFVDVIETTTEPPDVEHMTHGAAVTAAVLYGDIVPGQQLQPPPVHVTHYRAVPVADELTEMYSVLDQITEVVDSHQDGQIVNLSVGPHIAMTDADVHRWTAKLDELATKRNTLFVVAAGNNGEDDASLGFNRIQPPADMANALTVGACASRARTNVVRAPYSAVGPGRPGSRVQPVGVAFGGSTLEPFLCLDSDGSFSHDYGTSYATPLVTHGLGALAGQLDGRSSAAVLRAFAIHCATPCGEHSDVGYGQFALNYNHVLDYSLNEFTVLSKLNVTREGLHTVALPVPDGIPGNVKVRYTVAFQSPTEPTEATEYTQLGVELALRPHAGTFTFSDPVDDSKTRKLDVLGNPTEYRRLLEAGWRQSQYPATRSGHLPRELELSRREKGGKWETSIRLDDSMRGTSLYRPQLDLDFISRSGGVITRPKEPVSVAVIVTVAARADVDLYSQVRSQFSQLIEIMPTVEIQT